MFDCKASTAKAGCRVCIAEGAEGGLTEVDNIKLRHLDVGNVQERLSVPRLPFLDSAHEASFGREHVLEDSCGPFSDLRVPSKWAIRLHDSTLPQDVENGNHDHEVLRHKTVHTLALGVARLVQNCGS